MLQYLTFNFKNSFDWLTSQLVTEARLIALACIRYKSSSNKLLLLNNIRKNLASMQLTLGRLNTHVCIQANAHASVCAAC